MNYILFIFAVFIAIVGFMAARYYAQSTAENALQRAGYANFAAYVFGVAPILIMVLGMAGDLLAKRDPTRIMRARLHFGLYALMAIFAMALSAMLINDMRDDENRNNTVYGTAATVLTMSIVVLIYAVVVVAMPNKLADKYSAVTGFEEFPVAGFGNSEYDDDIYPHLFGFGRARGRGRRRRA